MTNLTSIGYAIARGIVEELKLKLELQPTASTSNQCQEGFDWGGQGNAFLGALKKKLYKFNKKTIPS